MLRSKVDRLVLKTMPFGSPKAQEISSYVVDSLATLAQMKTYRGFPERLHHRVPHWVEPGALFHIRIRLDREKQQRMLVDPSLAHALLDSAKFYQATMRWYITLFFLMPDHVHAVLSFPRDKSMSEVIRDWKRFHTRTHRVMWQEGYFDHRLRSDERALRSQQSQITFGRILWLLVCAPEQKTGPGLSILSRAKVDRPAAAGRWVLIRRRRR